MDKNKYTLSEKNSTESSNLLPKKDPQSFLRPLTTSPHITLSDFTESTKSLSTESLSSDSDDSSHRPTQESKKDSPQNESVNPFSLLLEKDQPNSVDEDSSDEDFIFTNNIKPTFDKPKTSKSKRVNMKLTNLDYENLVNFLLLSYKKRSRNHFHRRETSKELKELNYLNRNKELKYLNRNIVSDNEMRICIQQLQNKLEIESKKQGKDTPSTIKELADLFKNLSDPNFIFEYPYPRLFKIKSLKIT